MKKRIIIILSLIAMLTISAFAANAVIGNIKEASYSNFSVDKSLLKNEQLILADNVALKQLQSDMNKGEDINAPVKKYAYFISVLNPTDEEKDYIDSLIKKGYDAESLIDIYEFWIDTAENLDIIEKVYKYKPYEDDAKYWIENAFIALSNDGKTKNKLSDLTLEEAKHYYYDCDVSPDDMLVAGIMSRKGVHDVDEIIESHIEGKTWYDIADEIYDFSTSSENKEKYSEIDNGREILSCIRMSRTTGNDVITYFEDLVKGESVIEKKMLNDEHLMEDSITQLKAQKLLSEDS